MNMNCKMLSLFIKQAFEGWGGALRKLYGSKKNSRSQDLTLGRAGYWTDNGK